MLTLFIRSFDPVGFWTNIQVNRTTIIELTSEGEGQFCHTICVHRIAIIGFGLINTLAYPLT